GELMSRVIGISRVAIGKHIKALRAQGFDVYAKPGGGYTLDTVSDVLGDGLIMSYSKTDADVIVLETVKSTNIDAKAWAEDAAVHGAMMIAKTQSAGRGRKARHWQSVDGGIWSSTILRPTVAPNDIQPVTLAAAVAVTQAIKQNNPDAHPLIKWPNDVLINGKKVCGILTEFVGDMDAVRYLVVGIGINAAFSIKDLEGELLYTATTLQDENIDINRSKLIADVRDNLLALIDIWTETKSASHIIQYYKQHMAYKDEEVIITGAGHDTTGILVGILDDGTLKIQTDDGFEEVISGEISMRRNNHEI
ncbi:MAG: biotin--[acetyl-CoA-carboxylase] ligase, partial [Clostridiales bacterium]|nr:biotin--[acetyl-CoA-carboxylase] ligase [Clostridiales bacterium]